MQEQEKCQAEISRCRNEMELKYRENLEALHRREEEATERIRHQQQEQEAQSHAQRQSLLEELNVLRMREEAVKRDAELNMRAAKVEEERVSNMMEQLRLRESNLDSARKQIEQESEEKLRMLVSHE
jgi:oral-facial-digital syndrome 1 protein